MYTFDTVDIFIIYRAELYEIVFLTEAPRFPKGTLLFRTVARVHYTDEDEYGPLM